MAKKFRVLWVKPGGTEVQGYLSSVILNLSTTWAIWTLSHLALKEENTHVHIHTEGGVAESV